MDVNLCQVCDTRSGIEIEKQEKINAGIVSQTNTEFLNSFYFDSFFQRISSRKNCEHTKE